MMPRRPDPGWRWAGAGVAWLCGLMVQVQQAQTLPVSWSLTAALLAAFVACAGLRKVTWPAFMLGLAALAILAFASTDWRAAQRLLHTLPAELEGRDLVLTGTVAELPTLSPIGTRFVFDVESATLDGATVQVPPRLSLGWYHGYDGDTLLAGPAQPLSAGERWRLPVRLKRPHGVLNPHGFDLELWLFEQGIGASGTVRPGAQRLAERAAHPVERARQAVRDAILVRVPDASAAGVLAALVVGDQAAIVRDDWELFRATGVAHLMSISGLHVTMFAWLAGLLIGALWRWSPRLMLSVPTPVAARWGGLLLATAYALLAGWGVPAQRTVGMIAVVVLLRSAGVRWPQPMVLLAAGVAVTLADPWAVLQPGFWLSFVAVAVLIASGPVSGLAKPAGWRGTLRAALHTQVVATVGLAPLSLVFFNQVSVVGFVANLVAIPLITLVVTPLALLGVLLPALWLLAAGVLKGLALGLGLLAAWPWAVWSAAAAPAWALAAGLAGGALLVMPLPWRLRLMGLPLMLPLLAPPLERVPEGRFEAVFADIGQGTAVLVRTRSHLLVYDSGPAFGPEADAGGRVLLPLLRARGEQAIHLLVLSHQDSDHIGGARSLLQGLPVQATLTSLAEGHALRPLLPAHQRCEAGQQWVWDGVHFEVLHPTAAEHAGTAKTNALSCVLRVRDTTGQTLLLTGDIEAAQEAALAARHGAALRSSVLQVPHHGSRTSSTSAFLDAVAPQVAVVQAAYRSRFGHPAPDVIERYRQRGALLLRTDTCGAYTLPAGATIGHCERQKRRRYWHHRPL